VVAASLSAQHQAMANTAKASNIDRCCNSSARDWATAHSDGSKCNSEKKISVNNQLADNGTMDCKQQQGWHNIGIVARTPGKYIEQQSTSGNSTLSTSRTVEASASAQHSD